MKTPWHLWLVGSLTLLFNAGGAFDYLMTQSKNPDYMAQFSPAELAYFNGFPAWVQASWAIAVWGGVLGSTLLLFKARLAVPVLTITLAAVLVTMIHNLLIGEPRMQDVVGQEAVYFSAVIILMTLFLYIYARTMKRFGVLG